MAFASTVRRHTSSDVAQNLIARSWRTRSPLSGDAELDLRGFLIMRCAMRPSGDVMLDAKGPQAGRQAGLPFLSTRFAGRLYEALRCVGRRNGSPALLNKQIGVA